MNEVNLWWLGSTGIVAGLLGSMLGIGGGFIIVPILTLLLHLPIQIAVGSSLVAIVANACTAAGAYTKSGFTNIKLGLLLETTTIPGAIVGGFAAAYIPATVLSGLFGLLLLYVGYTMVARNYLASDNIDVTTDSNTNDSRLSKSLSDSYKDENIGKKVSYKVNRTPVGMGAGFGAGILSSLLGVGGGIIKVPVMHLVMGVPIKAAIATSTFMIALTAATGAFIHQHNDNLKPFIIAPLVIGTIIGSTAGVQLTKKIHGDWLRRIFGIFLFIVAMLMFLKTAGMID